MAQHEHLGPDQLHPVPAWVAGDETASWLWVEARRWAAQVANAPYSTLRVGAAGRLADGTLVRGANLESAAYTLTVHAEGAMLVERQARAATGAVPALTHVVCCDSDGRLLAPCGLCRQMLVEQAGPDVLIACPGGWMPLGELLPWHFGDQDLPGAQR